jgi:nucleoside-diphosphate-sugar epimerase
MKNYPEYIVNEEQLEEALSRPTDALIRMMKVLDGNIIFLGVAGKMGVSMARMAQRACKEAGVEKRIIGVSRFSSAEQQTFLEQSGIDTIKGDLLDLEFINSLPEEKNVFYLAGMKFGTEGNESFTWAMNSYLPGLVVEKFKNSKIVAFSTGCVYPLMQIDSGGSKETDPAGPVGEYAQSCLGRERLFEFGSIKNNTPVVLIRLNYAVEMRYGVLVDIATKVLNQETIDLTMGYANVIWQGDANEMILRSIQYCESPAKHLNISGSEVISVADIARRFGEIIDKKVKLSGVEADTALLVNVSQGHELLGKPAMDLDQVIRWTANWIRNNKRLLGKATHFEVRDGKY